MIVIKIGGAEGVDLDAICRDVAALVKQGQAVIMVHGGSAETNVISTQLGHPPRFVTSTCGFTSRYTDRETLEIFAMVTIGQNQHPAGRAPAAFRRECLWAVWRGRAGDPGPAQRSHPHRRKWPQDHAAG